jgi:FixJ family two-component response regulator
VALVKVNVRQSGILRWTIRPAWSEVDPDVSMARVVLNMRLQGMTALELQRRLPATGLAVPIISCTAE